LVRERDVGAGEALAGVDPHLVRAVDEDVGYAGEAEQWLEWSRAGEVGAECRGEREEFDVTEHDAFGAQGGGDAGGGGFPRRLREAGADGGDEALVCGGWRRGQWWRGRPRSGLSRR